MPAEYQEVRWADILREIMQDVAECCKDIPVNQHDDITGAWKLLPQWIELRSRFEPLEEVYDIGCGIGILSAFVAALNKESHVVSLDSNALNTNLLFRRKHGLVFEVSDICKSAWMIDAAVPNMVDAAILADVIQYLQHSPVQVFKLLHKILKPGGILYVACPDAASNHGKVYKYVTGYSEIPPCTGLLSLDACPSDEVYWNYTKAEVLEIASIVGFKPSRFGYSVTSKGQHLNFAFQK